MGSWRLRRSKKIGPLRVNVTKTGVGLSAGVPGARVSVHSSGRVTKTVGIPGTGIYYRDDKVLRPGSPTPVTYLVSPEAWLEVASLLSTLEDVAVAECGF